MNELIESIYDSKLGSLERLAKDSKELNELLEGVTPLQWAARLGPFEAVEILLRFGASPNVLDNDYRQNALHYATEASTDVVDLLIKAGANVNHQDATGMTPLMGAAKVGRLDIVKHLVQAGADPRAVDDHKLNALHWSAVGGEYPELNAYLIERGVDPEARTTYGKAYSELLDLIKAKRTAAR